MSERVTLRRLRTFLRLLAAGLFAGTVVELVLTGHTDGPVQFVPFALCGLGLLALMAVWMRPGRKTVRTLRVIMTVVVIGSGVGVAEHLWGNREFARETRPRASAMTLLLPTLTGVAPLLAPGILAVAAAVAMATTYGISVQKPSETASKCHANRGVAWLGHDRPSSRSAGRESDGEVAYVPAPYAHRARRSECMFDRCGARGEAVHYLPHKPRLEATGPRSSSRAMSDSCLGRREHTTANPRAALPLSAD